MIILEDKCGTFGRCDWVLVLALALLTAGCAGKIGYFRAPGLTQAEQGTVRQAFGAWCSASGGSKCPVLDPAGHAEIVVLRDFPSVQGELVPASIQGLYWSGASKILVRDHRDAPNWLEILRAVILHESGHHFFCRDEVLPFNGPSAMGNLPQTVATKGVVDLANLRSRGVCP